MLTSLFHHKGLAILAATTGALARLGETIERLPSPDLGE